MKYENITERYEYSGKDHLEYSSIKVDDICIISVYNSPNSAFDVLQRHMKEVINRSKEFCGNIIVVGDFNINLKVKTNHKLIDYMKSFGLTLINRLNKNSTNAKTQIDYCFANMHSMKSDYFESLTSFHKPIWMRKHKVLAKAHFDENEPLLVAPDGKAFHLTVNEPGGAIAALYDSRYAVLRKLREQRLELGDTFSGTRLGVEVCGGWDGLDPGMRILLEQDNGDETLSRIRAFASASIRLAKRVEEV